MTKSFITPVFLPHLITKPRRLSFASWKKRGWRAQTTDGRVFVFEPAVSREWVEKMCARTILEQNFGGSSAKLLVNLLESGPVADQELEELEALIRNYRIQKGELQH